MAQFYMPSRVFFGKNSLRMNGRMLASIGRKALIVTGKSSAERSGVLADLLPMLKALKIDYCHFNEVSENPELKTVLAGAEVLKKESCDFVIGIGGGSPLDAAKAISVVSANNLQADEIYQPDKMEAAHPIIAIPTTSGTGSEVTQYSVITDSEKQKKAGFGSPLIFPMLSFLDPAYTISLPKKNTVDTAIDALSHLLEGIYSRNRCSIIYPLLYKGVRLILDNLPQAIEEPENFTVRENLMLASMYGGMVIAQAGTTLQHSIGYPLTTHYGLSHGKANGVVMRHIMELYSPSIESELKSLLDSTGYDKESFYQWLNQWELEIGLNLTDDFIAKAVAEILQSRNMALNPHKIVGEEIVAILRKL